MSGNGDGKRIEKMFRDKQDRIARQIALQVAGQTVVVNPASAVKDPDIITSKVIRVAEIYYNWICNGGVK
jgi:hypothetical protein